MDAVLKPPTALRGVVDDTVYDSILYDALEHVPDLQPGLNAIQVYAQMRRDARLAAVESGYTLQLRRAQWQLDGAGCDPAVVRLVADDMGLMVAGEDRPTSARVRGVSWNDHLRAALLMLPYGFMAFEELAEIRDGQARLVALAERMPHSVSDIQADPASGALIGITQSAIGLARKQPQIPADRLVFYAHEREGAGWWGRSLFRPAWAPWLLKRELMRVHATSARRFGMGVPVVRALPGTTPTPGQMTEAMKLASAARVGDQSGAAVPPGFILELVGLSGGVPDVLGYIKWLDTQISSAALMPHLDLGNTESGSRALGTAFIDSWMLALGALGDAVCDVVTRQVCARIVEWNWGRDQPVPRVVVSGIGSRREVTAESLQLLLNSGALSADPALEAWVRREYRLPERTGPEPAARTATKTRQRTADREAEPARVEAAAPPPPVDAEQLAADHAAATAAATEEWSTASTVLVGALAAATAAELASGMLVGLGAMQVSPAVTAGLVTLVGDGMVALAVRAAEQAAREARGIADVDPDLPDDARARLGQVAQATVDMIVSGYATGAAREALRLSGQDLDVDAVERAVREHLEDLSQPKRSGLVHGNLASAMTTAQAAGREAVLAQLPTGTRFVASEANDLNRCAPCSDADGRVYDTLADALADYPAGKLKSCLGRDRCRGTIYPLPPGR